MEKRPQPFFRKDRQLWYVQIDGKQYNLGAHEEVAWQRYHELMAARTKATPAIGPSQPVLAVLEAFMEYLYRERSARTYEFYQRFLKSFHRSIPANLIVEQLLPAHVTDWLAGHTSWSPSTRHGAVHAVERAFRRAEREGRIERSPVANAEAPSPTRREAVISPGQWPHVLGAATDQEFRDLLTFLWETGARPQEASHVEARHFEEPHSRIVFPASESKGKKFPRVIYLTPAALEVVKRLCWRWPEGKLSRMPDGRPWTRNAIRCRFRRQRVNGRVKFKVPGLCCYAIRHSYATNALQRGVDPITLVVLMGHADASMIAKVCQHLTANPGFLLDAARRAKGAEPARSVPPKEALRDDGKADPDAA
jgi:integrase